MSRAVAITTTDNPYDPLDQFDEWYDYDESHGYHTCGTLARIAATSDYLSESTNDILREQAIDVMCDFNVTGKYIKIVRNE